MSLIINYFMWKDNKNTLKDFMKTEEWFST